MLGRAQVDWQRAQTPASAAAQLLSATEAVETALQMVGVAVGTGLVQTRAEVDAWQARRRMIAEVTAGAQTVGRVRVPGVERG